MKLSWLDWGLTCFGYTMEMGILVLLWRRRWISRLLVLFAYVGATLIGSAVNLYGRYHWPLTASSLFYWGKEAVIYVFSFLLVFSFWKTALESFRGVWLVLRAFLPVFFLGLLALVWWNAVIVPAQESQKFAAVYMWLLLANQALALPQAVFLVLLFLMLNLFQVPTGLLIKRLAACWFLFVVLKVAVDVVGYALDLRWLYAYGPAVGFCLLMAFWWAILATAGPEDLEPPRPPLWAARSTGRLAGNLDDVNRELSRLLKV